MMARNRPPAGQGRPCIPLAVLLVVALAASAPATTSAADCDSCPTTPEPVCAQAPGSQLSLTVAHKCFAECQGMTNVCAGACEGTAAPDGPEPAARARGGAAGPKFDDAPCSVTAADMAKYASEGFLFTGCPKFTDRAPGDGGSASGTPAAARQIAKAVDEASPGDVAIITATRVELPAKKGALGLMFSKVVQLPASDLARPVEGGRPTASGGIALTPSMPAPTPKAWARRQHKKPPRYPKLAASAAAANESDGEVLQPQETVVTAVSWEDAPLPPLGSLGRRLRQMADNRVRVASTTQWPFPTMTLLSFQANAGGFGCSGSLISPNDVLTAAHCVRDPVTGEFYRSYQVLPGADNGGNTKPYGSFTVKSQRTWSVWIGAPYAANQGYAAGSIFADIGLLELWESTTWWQGIAYSCGRKGVNVRTCGYPGALGWSPYCADGTTNAIDYCDATYDYLSSANAMMTGGESGGPVYDVSTGRIVAVNSGIRGSGSTVYESRFAPIDNKNIQLIVDPGYQATLWGSSYAFRSRWGPIPSAMNGKCIDVPMYQAGVRVRMWDCSSAPSQQWRRPGPNDLRLQVGNQNLCLDVYNGGNTDGTPVIIWTCTDGANQKFLFDSRGRLRPLHAPDKCVDIYGAQGNNGAQLVIWSCAPNNANQRWVY